MGSSTWFRAAAVDVALLAGLLVPRLALAQAGSPCGSETTTPDLCESSCCPPPGPPPPGSSGGGGGDNDDTGSDNTNENVSDPIDMAVGSTRLYRTDAVAKGTVAPLKLRRTFSPDPNSWEQMGVELFEPPFGRNWSYDTEIMWWHNFFSYAYGPVSPYVASVNIRNTFGRWIEFQNPCASPPCWVGSAFPADTDRLLYVDAGAEGTSFHLFSPDNEQYVYSVFYSDAVQGTGYWFLSSIVDVSGVTVATVNYRAPPLNSAGSAISGCYTGDAGAPFVGTVVNEDGAQLDFRYEMLDGGEWGPECVLQEVLLSDVNSSASPITQASYTYTGDRPGFLASATVAGPATITENYNYDAGGPLLVTDPSGTTLLRHTASTCASYVVGTSSTPSDGISIEWGNGSTCGYQNDAVSFCSGFYPYPRTATSSVSTIGNGNAPDGGFQRGYEMVAVEDLQLPRMGSYTDTCSTTNACSPGTYTYNWTCTNPYEANYPLSEEDKRGDYTIHPGTSSSDPTWVNQVSGLQIGGTSSSYDGGIPTYPNCEGLQCEWYGDSYGPVNHEQLQSTIKKTSVVDSAQMAETYYGYDGGPTGNFFTSTVKQGWLADGGATFIGTFQYPYCPSCGGSPAVDPLYRVLEKDGPCFVSSSSATACPSGTFPITEYAYYGSTSDNRTNRLETTTTYPAGTGGTALTTTYNSYDAYGNATSITDPAGVTTTYTYANNLLTQKVVDPSGSDLVTNYGYDEKKLTSIEYPGGNYETFCYRSGDTSSCNTSSGTYTPLLQWRSKSANANGSSPSEQVTYQYNGDGTVSVEQYYDGTGTLRREKQYQKDNQKRPTWEGWGSSPAYTEIRAFDGSDNLAGIGLPFNSAPAFCGSSENSTNCELLSSDAANRLTTVTEYPSSSGSALTTQLAYDTDGDVCAVTVNASGSWVNSCTYTGSADDPNTAYYQHDDFGNLLGATLPDTGTSAKGSYVYTYDALGDPLTKTLPDGSALSYTYDAMGRLTSAFEASYVAYDLTYDAATPPSGCSALTHTGGRLAERVDSFGSTYYSYDDMGSVLSEQRVRLGSSSCTAASHGVNPDTNPTTVYTYNANEDLLTITYPHGREVAYTYGSGGLADRVATVSVYTWNGSAWSSTEILQSVTWEPYGGLRAYQMDFAASAYGSVEYFAGASGTEPAADCAGISSGTLGTNDDTGLLRAVGVSSGALSLGNGTGNIANLFYTWQADQVKVRDLCVTDGGTPHRETFNPSDFAYNPSKPGYDQLLRVEHAEQPYRNTVGGTYNERDFGCAPGSSGCTTLGYDGRGNRLTPEAINTGDGGATLAYSYDGGSFQPDELVEVASQASTSDVGYWYTYDADGRAATKAWHKDSTGNPAHELSWVYGLAWGLDGGSSSIENIKTVTIQDGTTDVSYNYYYDAFNRRRFKAYPTAGVADEYFYDLGHQMLEERGSDSLTSSTPYPEDDYIWLDGRPVAYVRGEITSAWHRDADTTADCSELGDKLPCGIYFVVTDHLGKPTIALNDTREIVGVYDYDIFGAMNRYGYEGDTVHPYAKSTGTSACTTNADVIADVTERPIASGMSVDMRTRMHVVDTAAVGSTDKDYAMVRDGDEPTCLVTKIGGPHDGANVSAWVTPDAGHIQVTFYSQATSYCPDGGTCEASCSGTCPYPYTGVSMEAVDYREYQTGTTPLLLPIRFPGQYYDGETDLNENWNRFYDPSVGRYLEVEPMLMEAPTYQRSLAKKGEWLGAYAYAMDNPIQNSDPTGDYTWQGPFNQNSCIQYPAALSTAQNAVGCGDVPPPLGQCSPPNQPNQCQGALEACGVSPGAVCGVLQNGSGPGLQFNGAGTPSNADGQSICASSSSDPNGYASFQGSFCNTASSLGTFSATLLHEAIHLASGCSIGDGSGPCSAGALTAACGLND